MTITTVRNGVDTEALFGALDAVKSMPVAAKFQFRATNEWKSGTNSESTISGFYGLGSELAHNEVAHLRGRPSHPADRQRPRPNPGRVPAARARRRASPLASAMSPPPAA